MIIEGIEKEIVNRIFMAEKISKIIVFGSYAYGRPSEDSDIDLLVVIDKDEYPRNYKEKSDNFLRISRAIRPIEKDIPIDLLVYTKSEFEKFVELGSLFSRKILSEGRVLL
ncbi:MAG: nucleotidyltransferase domain-containing protein [Candidatus Brocadiaceae bacterium]|nr:nucleotidyltransferase domain-containing protein [Candidatus Brocadiaceae bacterium]